MKITVFGLRRDFEQREFCDVRLYEGWGDVRATALREVVDSDVVINASYCPEGARILDEVLELPAPGARLLQPGHPGDPSPCRHARGVPRGARLLARHAEV